jgi:intracellular multiplication protein IcmB
MVEARLATIKEKGAVIEEVSNLGVVDQLIDEILQAYAANPDVRKLPT